MREGEGDGGGGTAITAEAINGLQGDAFRNVLPEDVRGAGWMKDVNSFGDFVKKASGAQSLIGQRAVPQETDAPERWDAWFTQIGRPEKPDGYTLPTKIEGVPEEFLKDAAEAKVLQTLAHQAGHNPVQARRFTEGLIKHSYAAEQAETKAAEAAKAEATAKAEAAHNALMDATFGKDRQAITENGKKYLVSVLPPQVAAMVDTMTDQQLAVVLAATDSVAKKFGQEDSFRGGKGGNGGGAVETREGLTAQMREIMAQKEYQDQFLNKNKHAELVTKMEGIREKLRKLS
jgi:hypothetical protein